MAKFTSILTTVCLCLMFVGTGVKSYAEPRIRAEDLKEKIKWHIKKVKLTNLKKYQAMVERTQGNIKDCRSCHIEMEIMQRRK